jgi:UDP-2,4-diacetamido-2,4,6-trideoxy-beta-L-altropyranose hydrolase
MENKIACFSCEASLEIGTGHVMRSMVLAEKLQENDWNCFFVTSKNSQELIKKLDKFQIIDPQEFFNNPLNCDLLVVDNYDLDENYEKHFRQCVKKILVIDDLANRRHCCDFLIDQNFGTKEENYKNLVNESCKIFVGTDYAILRPEFYNLREKALEKRFQTKNIKKILVNFGGSDLKNHSLSALKMIENSSFVGEVDVVLGFNAIHFEVILDFSIKSKNKINVHRQANMSEIIFEADMAVAAGGSSVWERLCLALPSYLIKIADNQEKIVNSFMNKNESFVDFYQKLSQNYQGYIDKIVNIVDGKGVDRINQILKLCFKKN